MPRARKLRPDSSSTLESMPPKSDKLTAEPATLLDVARLAGVSAATVSRILNGTARVTADKRLAVETAIERLQFRPNFAAQSLRSGFTRTIGVLTQELESRRCISARARAQHRGRRDSWAAVYAPGRRARALESRGRNSIGRGCRDRATRVVDAMVILGGNLSGRAGERQLGAQAAHRDHRP